MINNICLEQLAESRGQTRSSDVFQWHISTYRGCVHTNGCHLRKRVSYASLYTLCQFIDPEIEFTIWKCVLQWCNNSPLLFFPYEEKDVFGTFLLLNFTTKNVAKKSIHVQCTLVEIEKFLECQSISDSEGKGKVYTKKEIIYFE